MDISKLDEVTALRNHREKALQLHHMAFGQLIDLRVGNDPVDAFSIISAEPIRSAVRDACIVYLLDLEAQLKKLGVRVDKPTAPLDGTAEQWRREFEMYGAAWRRELGKHIGRNRHLIDALVSGTKRMRRRYELLEAVAKAATAMPRESKGPGCCSDEYQYTLSAGTCWTLDLALRELEQFDKLYS